MAARQKHNTLSENRVLNRALVIHTLPGLMIFLALLLAFGLLMLVLSVVQRLHLGHLLLHPNPLATYEPLWPGQSIASVAEYGRRTPSGSIPCYGGESPPEANPGIEVFIASPTYAPNAGGKTHRMVCTRTLENDIFHSISLLIVDAQVQELDLFSETLQEDSLLLYWGIPDIVTRDGNGQTMYLTWNRSTYSAVAIIRLPGTIVRLVTLTANP